MIKLRCFFLLITILFAIPASADEIEDYKTCKSGFWAGCEFVHGLCEFYCSIAYPHPGSVVTSVDFDEAVAHGFCDGSCDVAFNACVYDELHDYCGYAPASMFPSLDP